MISISIAATAHRWAIVDMYNAAPQCDLLELRLDKLKRAPELSLLLAARNRPVLVSCRRREDGGEWDRSEEARQTVLREAITQGADYVEIEVDIAHRIPRFGDTKRVISFTSMYPLKGDLDMVYERATGQDADVVKLTAPTATLDEAWPILRAMAKPNVPVVAVGVGEPGLTLSLLGRKMGSPWIDAALEKGMEAHPGQATVRDLEEVYCWRDINRQTPLVGVAGFTPQQKTTVRLMNAAFKYLGLDMRCLPMEVGDIGRFGHMMESLRVSAVILNEAYWGNIFSELSGSEEAAKLSRHADIVIKQQQGWHGYSSLWRAAVYALEKKLPPRSDDGSPLKGRTVLLAGATSAARALAYGIQKRGGLLMVTGPDSDRAHLLAQMFGCRYVPLQRSFDTMYDVLVAAPSELNADGELQQNFDHAYLRANTTVLDLNEIPKVTHLLDEARARGAKTVDPMDVYLAQLVQRLRPLTGKDVPLDFLRQKLAEAEG
jgi:3-dehydroquinate dehydratase/shikimate dehydrogenase